MSVPDFDEPVTHAVERKRQGVALESDGGAGDRIHCTQRSRGQAQPLAVELQVAAERRAFQMADEEQGFTLVRVGADLDRVIGCDCAGPAPVRQPPGGGRSESCPWRARSD